MPRPLTLLLIATAAAAQQAPTPPPAQLPITRVALYKNGVGFFEHSGKISGDKAVTIDFTSAQLNDVLQSLTAIDLSGGRITGATYNSTTPLDQQLKALPLDLSANPSDTDFYNAIRGARVTATGPGLAITGRILSLDLREIPTTKSDTGITESHRFLTVIAETGATRTFELTPAVTVRLLDPALQLDVTHYLELLAANRSQGLRHLTLLDRGTGTRDLRVSYISEVPIWKSTYRILFTDTKASNATLQGWSVVDNTTGSDWINVHLDLIAGAPVSFIQPLSTPYYTRRPEIPLPQEAQLAPQTHDSGDVSMTGSSAGSPGGVMNGVTESVQVSADNVAVDAQQIQNLPMNDRKAASLGKMRQGVAGGYGAGIAGGIRAMPAVMAPPPAPIDYAQAAQTSLTPQTTTAAFDDFFQYSLTDPITIRKNESALVPILQTKLPIERVTLWSPQNPQALRALWLTNSSNLTLDRGSFSIVENGSFGGEGLLDPIHPNERRLLSYAADQAVRVTIANNSQTRRAQRITIAKGVLTETVADVRDYTYDIRNASPDPRTVILEDTKSPGFTLDATPKPDESTPTVDRFRVAAAPNATAHLHLISRRTDYEYIRLVDRTEDNLILLLRDAKVSPAALQQLQPVFDAHHAVVAIDDQIRAAQAEINTITQDQSRLRENLKSLKGTPEEKALATRYTAELNTQEDRLATLNTQITTLRQQRQLADQDFQNKLAAVNFEQTL